MTLMWLTTQQRDTLYQWVSLGTLDDLNQAQAYMFTIYYGFQLPKGIFCPTIYLAQEIIYHISDLRFAHLTPERRSFLQGECINKINVLHDWSK